MITGKQLKLERDTLAIGTIDRVRRVVTIPIGEIIHVVSHHKDGGMLNVLWKDRTLMMFEVDVDARGTEIRARDLL